MKLLFLSGLILALIALVIAGTTELPILTPDVPLEHETIRWGDTKYYSIQGLKMSSFYEVRISYPAYFPTQFEVEIVPASGRRGSRDLQNIEKTIFTTDIYGKIHGIPLSGDSDSYLVVVSALYDGYSNRKGYDDREVEYNIVLETLVYGAPIGIFKLGILIFSLIVLAVSALMWTPLPRFLGFAPEIQKRD